MTTEEITLLPPGTQIYLIENAEIKAFCLLGLHPKEKNYLYLISKSCVSKVTCIYIPTHTNLTWRGNYEQAKEVLWEQTKKRVADINEIYMEGKKEFKFEE